MKYIFSLLAGIMLSSFCCVIQAATLQDCTDCPIMAVIPAGKFMMGDVNDSSALPVHLVNFKYRFAIGQSEITEAQFRIFLKRTGYNSGASHASTSFAPKHPAVDVDWYGASAYALWLSRYTGQRYRLPSEAEWDYAAHEGKSTRYWWGDSAAEGCGKEHLPATFFRYDQPCASTVNQDVVDVASSSANPLGLFDMQGNAGEWMLDCPPVEAAAYVGAPGDGTPFMGCSVNIYQHVVRGPSFLDNATPRRKVDATEHSANTGFRVVRELP